ncbi:MAG: DUF1476 domain-containing protein [Parvularculaceae bacterium]
MTKRCGSKTEARRNKMLGLWAAELMGLTGDKADEYASSVIRADFEEAGDEDVFRKVKGDLDAAGVRPVDHQIRQHMDEFLSRAIREIQDAG